MSSKRGKTVKFSSQTIGGLICPIQSFLWQYVYKDYYKTRNMGFLDSEAVQLEHLSKWLTFIAFRTVLSPVPCIAHPLHLLQERGVHL